MSLETAISAVRWKDLVREARGLDRKQRAALVSALENDSSLPSAPLFSLVLARLSERPPAVWNEGLQAIHDLTIQSPHDETLDALAHHPMLLEALQGAVAARPDSLQFSVVKVLCIDGGPASVDALLPVVHHALKTGGPTLDRLLQLERVVRKKGRVLPATIETVFATLHERQQERKEGSGVAALFEHLELDPKRSAFRLTVHSDEFKIELFADSEKAHDGFALYCTRPATPNVPPVYAAHQLTLKLDERSLGACSIGEFPQWLARAAGKLPTRWLKDSILVEARQAEMRKRIATWASSGLQSGPNT